MYLCVYIESSFSLEHEIYIYVKKLSFYSLNGKIKVWVLRAIIKIFLKDIFIFS